MVLAWAVMLQNFDFEMDDPSYKLSLQETLTIRPKGFFVKARPRGGMTPIELEARLAGSFLQHNTSDAIGGNAIKAGTKTGRRLAIFYGSDSGTCEYMAHKLASDAARHGYDAFINPLDSAKDDLPKDTPVVILTASYEGQPPHNATKFVKWTEGLEGSELAGVSYSVWGCGKYFF
jgi:cytochrome P450/NADPH-cytochrome P450 reductase